VRQNIYDDEAFFRGYADLRAQPGNLNDLVEQPVLRGLLPPLAGATVLDMGCGAGSLSAYCAGQGAARVVAADISKKMLALARERNAHPNIEYLRAAIEDLSFAPDTFEVVVSSFAVHYVQDYITLAANVSRWLTPGGTLAFSTEHPMITARKADGPGWVRDEAGNKLYWPVDDYGDEGERRLHWFVDGVAKYHRTMGTLVNGLVSAGLTVTQLVEPVASKEALRREPGLATLARFPTCLIVQGVKASDAA
jgi:SAM-dependent methyltransferase